MHAQTLILVDEHDKQIGVEEKLTTHTNNLLHRAFSIMIFNNKGELLIQQRAQCKYHSAGLWSNSCCGHPQINENIHAAATKRLKEELGFECSLIKITEIRYKLSLGSNMYENEYTHVFSGLYEGNITPNPEEVQAVNWRLPELLKIASYSNPHDNTKWFNLYLQQYYSEIFDKIPGIN